MFVKQMNGHTSCSGNITWDSELLYIRVSLSSRTHVCQEIRTKMFSQGNDNSRYVHINLHTYIHIHA